MMWGLLGYFAVGLCLAILMPVRKRTRAFLFVAWPLHWLWHTGGRGHIG